jgi:hypothetical protein
MAKEYPIQQLEPILNDLKIPYWFPENTDGNGHFISENQIFQEYERITGKQALKNGLSRTSHFIQWRNKIQRDLIQGMTEEDTEKEGL